MSFSIIIEDANKQEIERCWRIGNERYLLQESEDEFPLLSNLNLASYDVFGCEQVTALEEELLVLAGKARETEEQSFLTRIAEMVKSVAEREGWTITFTPFSK